MVPAQAMWGCFAVLLGERTSYSFERLLYRPFTPAASPLSPPLQLGCGNTTEIDAGLSLSRLH